MTEINVTSPTGIREVKRFGGADIARCSGTRSSASGLAGWFRGSARLRFRASRRVPVDVQVMIAPGKINMHIVGLPDKAVAESRERVQAALHASGLSLPPKKVTVNLAPADLPKEGSHYDLPIALA
jgi:hypothetical protein